MSKTNCNRFSVMLMTMWLMLASVIAAAAATIRVDRDDKGAWFITGPEDAPLKDVFKAMGQSVATDRLWQMELTAAPALGGWQKSLVRTCSSPTK